MRGQKEKSGIIELGKRSILSFFFEHPMSTYAAALAYRGLFGLFPFLLILVVLVGALGFADYLERAMDQASTEHTSTSPSNSNRWSSRPGSRSNLFSDVRAGREAGGRRACSSSGWASRCGPSRR